MVLKETPTCNFDEKAFDFKLIGTDEKIWTLTDCAGTNGTLIMLFAPIVHTSKQFNQN